MMDAFSADGLTIDDYVALITNDRDHAYAERLVAEGVPDLLRRYEKKMREDDTRGWHLCLPYIPEGSMPELVAGAIQSDIERLTYIQVHHERYGIFSEYARHLRTVERRKRTRAANAPFRRSTPRDSQQKRLYAAEKVLDGVVGQQRWGEGSVPQVQAYVDRLIASAWWRRRYPRVPHVTMHSGAGNRKATAHYLSRTIKLPLWARKEWVVLHELSHLATDSVYGHDGVAAHGREYARIYVELVGHVLGKDAVDTLKASFRQHRVKYSKPRTMTSEQRAAAAARLVSVRAAAKEHP